MYHMLDQWYLHIIAIRIDILISTISHSNTATKSTPAVPQMFVTRSSRNPNPIQRTKTDLVARLSGNIANTVNQQTQENLPQPQNNKSSNNSRTETGGDVDSWFSKEQGRTLLRQFRRLDLIHQISSRRISLVWSCLDGTRGNPLKQPGLWSVEGQIGRVVFVRHLFVTSRTTEFWVVLEEVLVAAFEQINLWIFQWWVILGVQISVEISEVSQTVIEKKTGYILDSSCFHSQYFPHSLIM